jgi:hypothetical protein
VRLGPQKKDPPRGHLVGGLPERRFPAPGYPALADASQLTILAFINSFLRLHAGPFAYISGCGLLRLVRISGGGHGREVER